MIVDQKHLTFNITILENLFGLISILWFIEANESESITFMISTNIQIIDLTITIQKIGTVLLFPLIREIFDIKTTFSF